MRGRTIMALAAGVLLAVGSWAWTAPASAEPWAGPRPVAAGQGAADAMVKTPVAPPNACTVVVNGEKGPRDLRVRRAGAV
jgi:hypothetical protein